MVGKRPRNDSIKYFVTRIKSHDKVLSVEQIDDQVFEIVKINGKSVIVYLTDIYIVSEAEVFEIKSENKRINAIVTISNWNSYSDNGKEIAKENGIGLFLMSEFMGAINFEGQKFLDYLSPAQREEIRRRERGLI